MFLYGRLCLGSIQRLRSLAFLFFEMEKHVYITQSKVLKNV